MIFVKILLLCVIFTQKSSTFASTAECGNLFLENLQNLLDFCIFNPIYRNSDENLVNFDEDVEGNLLGISIARGQLRSLKRGKYEIRIILNKLEVLEKVLRSNNEVHRKFLEPPQLLLFDSPFPISYGNLQPILAPNFHSLNNYLKAINDDFNQPNGLNSDRCIDEVFENCKISEKCKAVEGVEGNAFGYSKTHKLLFHIFNHLACLNQNFTLIASQLCSEIYHEAQFITTTVAKSINESRDLFMEQAFVCIYTGFGEFLRNDWIREILSFQLNSGCFSFDGVNCSPHMNGLGLAMLATLGRIFDEKIS